MTLETCEIQSVEMLAALDALGAGASRSACYVAMAIDSMGDARADVATKASPWRVIAGGRQVAD